ncbi:MAG: helix-turn-helix transcriptional regulator [Rhodobacter sp.]|nr:helix-turn-helix transcriptional regulator [Rhodobacter sp.]
MRSYGQFCPIAKAAELFCERWTPLIIRELATGATRFSEVRRGVPLMSPTLLSRRLRQLEAEGIVIRASPGRGKNLTYRLTEAGLEFVPLIEGLGRWGQHWSRRELAENEVDLGLLIWSLEKSVDASAFEGDRTVVRLEFTDQPASKSLWWFVNKAASCELCLQDPGFDVDLYVACTLPDMIRVIRGDIALTRALDDGLIDLHGTANTHRRFRDWLNLSPLSRIESRRTAP